MWERKKSENNNKDQQAKNAWLLIIGVFIVILAVLFFGRAYWQKQEASFIDEKQLFEQISDLKGQIDELQKNISKKEEPVKLPERTAITKEIMPKIINCDDEDLYKIPENVDRADKTVVYLNQDKKISFDVPFNESWGTKDYKLNPYDEIKKDGITTGLDFGLSSIFHPGDVATECDWVRQYSLEFLPAQTITKALAEISKLSTKPEKKDINGYSVIEYKTENDLFDSPAAYLVVRVLDKTASYEFEQVIEPWISSMPNFENLENIVKTLKPLE